MSKIAQSTVRTARLIWCGVLLQAALFVFYGVDLFLTSSQITTDKAWPIVLFAVMGFATLLYGYKFFQISTRLRLKELMAENEKKRRESLLLLMVIQFLLLEFVAILGVFLAVFMQSKFLVYPFYFLSLAALTASFPRDHWVNPFFPEELAKASKSGETP